MIFRTIIVISSLLLLSSCSKLTLQNYQQLKTGMDYEKVIAIIGSPDSCDEQLGTRSCIWGKDDGSHIKASFLAEKAILFSHNDLN